MKGYAIHDFTFTCISGDLISASFAKDHITPQNVQLSHQVKPFNEILIIKNFIWIWNFNWAVGICKLDSGGGAVLQHCPHRTAPLRP